MNRRIAIIRRRKLITLLVATVMSLIFIFAVGSLKMNANESKTYYKYYSSYEIKSGDTLWTIADEFIIPYEIEKEDFIKEVRQINHIDMDGTLCAGGILVVPYYSEEIL